MTLQEAIGIARKKLAGEEVPSIEAKMAYDVLADFHPV